MKRLRVIFAVEDVEERRAFAELAEKVGFDVVLPADIPEIERLYSSDSANAIVTDYRWRGGALADWLTLWPLPSVLVVEPGDDLDRIERTIRDESSVFVERSPGGGHLRLLPALIRKVINIRESLQRQNFHFQMSEHQYLNLLQAIPDIVYMLDGEGRFIYLNDAVRSLGFEPAKLIGRHFSAIIDPVDVPKVSRLEVLASFKGTVTGAEGSPKLFDERRSGKRMTRNLELRLRPGNDAGDPLVAAINAYGEVSCVGCELPEFAGVDLGTVGIIRDISSRKRHERELEQAVHSRDTLLKEIHHRVKNNLQVVSSLLSLQGVSISDPGSRKVFIECQTQIQSMAMVHEVLYRSGDFHGVEMQKYFESLVEYLSGVYDIAMRGIECAVDAPSVVLGLDDAIAVALIVNELVSNSIKHAFPEGSGGRILVSMAPREGDWKVAVADDGMGFGAPPRRKAEGGIGMELIEALAAQLRGSFEIDGARPEGGTAAEIRFPRVREPEDPGERK